VIVHQFLPTFELGAVGSHSLLARDQLRAAGHESEIFATEVFPPYDDRGARLIDQYKGGADVIVYQMAIGSTAADAALARKEPIVVNYHNLTPIHCLTGWEPNAATGVMWGRVQLRDLAARARLGVAVSSFNEMDLVDAGFVHTKVVPFLLDLKALPHPTVGAPARERATTWLFVGRIAPNKAEHDLVKALVAYRRFFDPNARLVLVGGGTDDRYARTLRRYIHALGLDDAVTLTGPVSGDALAAHYETADVLVVTSDHEGFCVPLIEAMAYDLPIVAYGSSAIPETLGDAGLLLPDKDPYVVATAVHRVLTDKRLRAQLVAAGRERMQQFDITHTGPAWVDAVTSVGR
jgi:glycosyltransferase involved in cell wall biosynthesis